MVTLNRNLSIPRVQALGALMGPDGLRRLAGCCGCPADLREVLVRNKVMFRRGGPRRSLG
jgi:hypothetical protein